MPVIKESSDALTPPVVTHAFIERAPRRRRAGDYVALAVASCGVGYIPVAPGTWGSGVGLAIYLAFGVFVGNFFPLPSASAENVAGIDAVSNLLQVRESAHLWQTTAYLLLLTVVVLVGIWAATRAEPLLGRKDPGVVVVDEVAGQLITFLFVPAGAPWWLDRRGLRHVPRLRHLEAVPDPPARSARIGPRHHGRRRARGRVRGDADGAAGIDLFTSVDGGQNGRTKRRDDFGGLENREHGDARARRRGDEQRDAERRGREREGEHGRLRLRLRRRARRLFAQARRPKAAAAVAPTAATRAARCKSGQWSVVSGQWLSSRRRERNHVALIHCPLIAFPLDTSLLTVGHFLNSTTASLTTDH